MSAIPSLTATRVLAHTSHFLSEDYLAMRAATKNTCTHFFVLAESYIM